MSGAPPGSLKRYISERAVSGAPPGHALVVGACGTTVMPAATGLEATGLEGGAGGEAGIIQTGSSSP